MVIMSNTSSVRAEDHNALLCQRRIGNPFFFTFSSITVICRSCTLLWINVEQTKIASIIVSNF